MRRYLLAFAFLCPLAAQAFCFEEAGARYGVSPALLHAIAVHESKLNPRAVRRNTNGTVDIGLMQINSVWQAKLSQFGIDGSRLADPCTNVMVGAWILSRHVTRYGYSWLSVGAYHSQTPVRQVWYANQIYATLRSLGAGG